VTTKINRRHFIKSLGFGAGIFILGGCAEQTGGSLKAGGFGDGQTEQTHPQASLKAATLVSLKKPNIILIMADDIVYECFCCYGSESYKTPVLDELGLRDNMLVFFTGDNGTNKNIKSKMPGGIIQGDKGQTTDTLEQNPNPRGRQTAEARKHLQAVLDSIK
jgi:hypothetical protein